MINHSPTPTPGAIPHEQGPGETNRRKEQEQGTGAGNRSIEQEQGTGAGNRSKGQEQLTVAKKIIKFSLNSGDSWIPGSSFFRLFRMSSFHAG